MVKKYRKKPIIVDALQWTGGNLNAVRDFLGKSWGWIEEDRCIMVRTLEGNMLCKPGDYLIKGVAGEFYPCKESIFNATYELYPSTTASNTETPSGS